MIVFLAHKCVFSNFVCILPKAGIYIFQDIRNQFKILINTYQKCIDDRTDLNINNSILICEYGLWFTQGTNVFLMELEKTNDIDFYFNINPNVFPIFSNLL